MKTLRVDKIVLGYGRQAPAIIRGLSLTLEPGEVVGVVGPNRSGKSTLVRALTRVLAPLAGTVLLDGRDLYTATAARDSARSIAAVPQSTTIAFDFTVREVVEMGRTAHRSPSPFGGAPDDSAVVDEAMRQTDVAQLAGRIASTLSGGELQRVILARALAQEPDILMLDEPTSSLDLLHQTRVLRLVQKLTKERGMASLVVLHDLNLAASCADRLLMMAAGKTIAIGAPA